MVVIKNCLNCNYPNIQGKPCGLRIELIENNESLLNSCCYWEEKFEGAMKEIK